MNVIKWFLICVLIILSVPLIEIGYIEHTIKDVHDVSTVQNTESIVSKPKDTIILLENLPLNFEGLSADDEKNSNKKSVIRISKLDPRLESKTKKIPALSQQDIHSLYENVDPYDVSKFAQRLHKVISDHCEKLLCSGYQFSHYLVDRLEIEANVTLSYLERSEQIQYLSDASNFDGSFLDYQEETGFLLQILGSLPVGKQSPQWRSDWYQRLDQFSKQGEVRDIDEGWQDRIGDYQQVRKQLAHQLVDQPEVFKVAQQDLRSSYFTDNEIALIRVTDNTIDVLNSLTNE